VDSQCQRLSSRLDFKIILGKIDVDCAALTDLTYSRILVIFEELPV
jgi:hypothetical protein